MARRTAYKVLLKRRIEDSASWPDFPTPPFLNRLERLARRALSSRTVEGNISAILLFHQLVEQMARVLIADTQFMTQLSVYPFRIQCSERRGQTFGRVVETLTEGMQFPQRAQFVRRARLMNVLRNDIAHALVQRGSLGGIAHSAKRASIMYEQAYEHFAGAHEFFREAFGEFRKNPEFLDASITRRQT